VTYIRTSQLGWPNGLAVDIRFRRVWWCDAMLDRYLSWFTATASHHSECLIYNNNTDDVDDDDDKHVYIQQS